MVLKFIENELNAVLRHGEMLHTVGWKDPVTFVEGTPTMSQIFTIHGGDVKLTTGCNAHFIVDRSELALSRISNSQFAVAFPDTREIKTRLPTTTSDVSDIPMMVWADGKEDGEENKARSIQNLKLLFPDTTNDFCIEYVGGNSITVDLTTVSLSGSVCDALIRRNFGAFSGYLDCVLGFEFKKEVKPADEKQAEAELVCLEAHSGRPMIVFLTALQGDNWSVFYTQSTGVVVNASGTRNEAVAFGRKLLDANRDAKSSDELCSQPADVNEHQDVFVPCVATTRVPKLPKKRDRDQALSDLFEEMSRMSDVGFPRADIMRRMSSYFSPDNYHPPISAPPPGTFV